MDEGGDGVVGQSAAARDGARRVGGETNMKRWEWPLMAAGAAALILGAWSGTLPLGMTETFAAVTGAITVWLVVKQNIWNWPIGIASSAFFLVLFFSERLFADMTLQLIYIVLGFLGWYWWLRGGAGQTALQVSRATPATLLVVGGLVVVGTAGMTAFLRSVGDAAPFLDALTTTLSLAAQYLLTRKLIENWYVWIAADIIYIGLYASRELYLTAALYALFLVLCLQGLRQWRQSPSAAPAPALVTIPEGAR